ncbi:glycosyltransferase family 2 protein [Psychrobacter namhaensis]|uniref:glycosyltransferase family 2 protein n=1 Tax=Psychrobacter namhaensis TaxID=292734 RepID=UPI003D065706
MSESKKESSDLVSIIIPTFKRTDMLSRALDNLLSQTYLNIEIVIVDDNGQNKEFDQHIKSILLKYSKLFNKFKYIKNEINIGASESRNKGVEASSGFFVTFLDDDDEYLPNKIEKQVNLFKCSEVSSLAAVYCQHKAIAQSTNNLLYETSFFYKGGEDILINLLPRTVAPTPALFCTKKVFIDIGGFRNLATGEDWCFLIDVISAGYSIDFNEEVLLVHYVHDGERVSSSNKKIYTRISENLKIKEDIIARYSFSDTEAAQVYFWHYYTVASRFKYSNKILALKYAYKATEYSFQKKELGKFFLGLIIGKKSIRLLKTLKNYKS